MKNIKQRLVTLALSSSIVLGTGVFSFADETTQVGVQHNQTSQTADVVNDVSVTGDGNTANVESTVTNKNTAQMNASQDAANAPKPAGEAAKPEQKPAEQKPAEEAAKPEQKPEGDKNTQVGAQVNETYQGGYIYNGVNINGNNNNVNISNTINNINNTYMNAYQSINSPSKKPSKVTPSKVTPEKVTYKKSTAKVTTKVVNDTSNPKTGDESLAVAAVGLLGAGSMLVARRKSEN